MTELNAACAGIILLAVIAALGCVRAHIAPMEQRDTDNLKFDVVSEINSKIAINGVDFAIVCDDDGSWYLIDGVQVTKKDYLERVSYELYPITTKRGS